MELAEGSNDPRGRPGTRWGLAVAMLGLAVCLATCALVGVWGAGSGRSGGGPLLVVNAPIIICVGVLTHPRLQIGVGWESLVMSAAPPSVVFSPFTACLHTRMWPAVIPMRGERMFPP